MFSQIELEGQTVGLLPNREALGVLKFNCSGGGHHSFPIDHHGDGGHCAPVSGHCGDHTGGHSGGHGGCGDGHQDHGHDRNHGNGHHRDHHRPEHGGNGGHSGGHSGGHGHMGGRC